MQKIYTHVPYVTRTTAGKKMYFLYNHFIYSSMFLTRFWWISSHISINTSDVTYTSPKKFYHDFFFPAGKILRSLHRYRSVRWNRNFILGKKTSRFVFQNFCLEKRILKPRICFETLIFKISKLLKFQWFPLVRVRIRKVE